jgi:hypothetical protein
MTLTNSATTRRVTPRDFLVGSIWEGTGEELHVNRHVAAAGEFGGRILSGISGMLLALSTYDPSMAGAHPSTLIWSFNGPLREDDTLHVSGTPRDEGYAVRGSVGTDTARPATAGEIEFGPRVSNLTAGGWSTRGRTFTSADIELFWQWMGNTQDPPGDNVPWPLIVLTASGLVSRTNYLGDHDMVLNRGFKWHFAGLPSVDDTIHCVVGPLRTRTSSSRPDLKVADYEVGVVSSPTGHIYATVDWTVMFR